MAVHVSDVRANTDIPRDESQDYHSANCGSGIALSADATGLCGIPYVYLECTGLYDTVTGERQIDLEVIEEFNQRFEEGIEGITGPSSVYITIDEMGMFEHMTGHIAEFDLQIENCYGNRSPIHRFALHIVDTPLTNGSGLEFSPRCVFEDEDEDNSEDKLLFIRDKRN